VYRSSEHGGTISLPEIGVPDGAAAAHRRAS
jgi:hypothetical protein